MTDEQREITARIDACLRNGWTCRLTPGHVSAIACDIDTWVDRGLPEAAAMRIYRAAKRARGARLNVEEMRDIDLAADSRSEAPAKETR